MAVMPTGGGKSLCYQVPMLMRPGFGLVISPLISLMRDQVNALRRRGIRAECLTSLQTDELQQAIVKKVRAGEIQILYAAPERLSSPHFAGLLARKRPNLIAIDEAHCIVEWGNGFRTAYATSWDDAEPLLKGIQTCAFTATATPAVRQQIKALVNRPEMAEIVAGFSRPNLSFSVERIDRRTQKLKRLKRLLDEKVPTIVYMDSRLGVDQVAKKFGLVKYHAGMDRSQRNEAQRRFESDPCPAIVATSAFGMGIDRPDIRLVVHLTPPSSLEEYYQQAGRAGRDGKPARCILLYGRLDCLRKRRYIVNTFPSEQDIEEALDSLKLRTSHRPEWMPVPLVPEIVANMFPNLHDQEAIDAAVQILVRTRTVATYQPAEDEPSLYVRLKEYRIHDGMTVTATRIAEGLRRIHDRFQNYDFCISRELQTHLAFTKNRSAIQKAFQNLQSRGFLDAYETDALLVTDVAKAPNLNRVKGEIRQELERRLKALTQVQLYATNLNTCRQEMFSRIFAGELVPPCRTCDVCTGTVSKKPPRKPRGNH